MLPEPLPYFFGPEYWPRFSELVAEYRGKGVFILCDSNTELFCLPILLNHIASDIDVKIITVKPGEDSKSIDTTVLIWKKLHDYYASRNSILICLGGGVITDLGAFTASTFKRGMRYVLMPTSLLSMVDAAIGGKNGINFHGVKNQIGTIGHYAPVFVFPEFLVTLSARERLSGSAEMMKHSLLKGKDVLLHLISNFLSVKHIDESVIFDSARFKMEVVEQDKMDTSIRKILNFGHTIGHSLEAYSAKYDSHPLTHGEAIAAGLICELYLSCRVLGFPLSDLEWVSNIITWHFPVYKFRKHSSNELMNFMMNDKKNHTSIDINFTLLRAIGEPVIDQYPGEKLVRESLHFYLNLENGIFPAAI